MNIHSSGHSVDTKNKMQGSGGGGDVSNAGGMPDPINALQNLASQGSRPQQQMMGMGGPQGGPMGGPGGPQGSNIPASNLLQTLTQVCIASIDCRGDLNSKWASGCKYPELQAL